MEIIFRQEIGTGNYQLQQACASFLHAGLGEVLALLLSKAPAGVESWGSSSQRTSQCAAVPGYPYGLLLP